MRSVSDKLYVGVLIAALAIFCAVSYANLTTWPAFWYDEGLAVEVAHNVSSFHVLDVATAPGVFSPYATVLAGSSGYTVTVPLAGVFSLTGFSLFTARLYMLLWCVLCIGVIFYFIRKFFDTKLAVLSSLLVLSFSSFFANGRTVTGEIPGFSFLLLGLWLFLKDKLFFAGLLFGLAAVSKPSLYLLLFVPIAVDIFFWSKERTWLSIFKRSAQVAAGYALPILLWFFFTLPRPLGLASLDSLISFYRNPFGSTSVLSNVVSNLLQLPHQSTIVYFFILCCTVLCGFYLIPRAEVRVVQRRIFLFLCILGAISFVYFLRSPGWLRYLVPLEFGALILLPVSLQNIFSRFSRTKIATALCIGVLVLLQIYVLLFHSDVFRSDRAQLVAAYIVANLGNGTVGIVNEPTIAALMPPGRYYSYLSLTGVPVHGIDTLSLPLDQLPKFFIVSDANRNLIAPYESVLQTYYMPVLPQEGSLVFERMQ